MMTNMHIFFGNMLSTYSF